MVSEEADHEDVEWYIELAESIPIPIYILLFLLPIIASFVQIAREEQQRKDRKKR
jgi:hypothetical protein